MIAPPKLPIAEVTARLTPAVVWAALGLRGKPGRSIKSPLREDANPSFSVYENAGKWKWKDHASEEGGDLIDLIPKARDCSNEEALRFARELVGGAAHGRGVPASHGRRGRGWKNAVNAARQSGEPARETERRFKPKAWPDHVRDAWREGADWLLRNEIEIPRLAKWRGIAPQTVRELVKEGLLSMPVCRGNRAVSFLVQYPRRGGWMPVGYHARHEPRRAGLRAWWTYEPGGIFAVPFVIGSFPICRLAIITEGEWDALAFADAAGWLAHETAFPEGVALVAVRGSTGWRSFLDHYGPRYWPTAARFLLIPDHDQAGQKWREEFLVALKPLARSVHLLTPAPPHKDFNDAHRADPFTPEAIDAVLGRLGLIDAEGRLL